MDYCTRTVEMTMAYSWSFCPKCPTSSNCWSKALKQQVSVCSGGMQGMWGGWERRELLFPPLSKWWAETVVMAEPERVNIDLTVKNTPRSVCSRLLNATNKQENEKRIQVYWDNDIPWASKAGVICANVTFYSARKRNAFKDLMCGTGPPRQLQIWGKCSKDDVIIYPSCTRREQKQFTVPQDLLINKSPLREAQSSHRL